ncbi:polysaccharide pyruvyl transferase family protein [Microbacterium betulae]|uniref:Polysaccharide pyruvyl transferase family protein n=1 Tax=Microbacterium betulae TaxID=2981139 RepID=A0AA97FHV4_9MICO|nr:polysaccharide pyruvyl transferase family protein [Microbacterium sp. AB]WOF22359.1 polysaccharide pyruvyl transferase family protein [Microbacterium sp. AB]
MLNQQDSDHLAKLRTETKNTLRETIGDTRHVAIIDAPNQRNVGDSLIWEGELAYLTQLGYEISYVCDLNSYDPKDVRRRLPKGGTVLLHGGGNFGDLWPGHQALRERAVADLHDYRIVQLSQSVYFSDDERARAANRVLGAHPDFRVLLRDTLSLQRASRLLPDLNCTFCPDMALGYSPRLPDGVAREPREVLVIARADKESASGLRSIDSDWAAPYELHVTDWGLHASDPLGWKAARLVARFNHKIVAVRRRLHVPLPSLPQRLLQRVVLYINARNADSALRLYAQARAVVVDRLHAHVLSVLLGIPHVMLDNNYRKLGAVFDDYTGEFTTARYSLDLDDARRQTQEVLEQR